jgi:hypothetical protein
MDRSMSLRHLEQAERHIELGEKHLADQEQRVLDLELRGRDAGVARQLLETFRLSQAQHIQHHELILKELAE